MEAIIYVWPPTTEATAGHIIIKNSIFYKNKDTSFIKVKEESQVVW